MGWGGRSGLESRRQVPVRPVLSRSGQLKDRRQLGREPLERKNWGVPFEPRGILYSPGGACSNEKLVTICRRSVGARAGDHGLGAFQRSGMGGRGLER